MPGLFRKPHTVRRHGAQTVSRGHASAPYTDMTMRLNVQPKAPNKTEALPEGDSSAKRLKAWGSERLTAADDMAGTPGDLLFHMGAWYECTSSVRWPHLLAHWQSDFAMLPPDRQPPPPEGGEAP